MGLDELSKELWKALPDLANVQLEGSRTIAVEWRELEGRIKLLKSGHCEVTIMSNRGKPCVSVTLERGVVPDEVGAAKLLIQLLRQEDLRPGPNPKNMDPPKLPRRG